MHEQNPFISFYLKMSVTGEIKMLSDPKIAVGRPFTRTKFGYGYHFQSMW